jgi:Fe2+ transport system protein FeoA
MFELIPVHLLNSGDYAQVAHIAGQPEQIQRVRELGLQDGAQIQMVQSGTPCIFKLGHQTLCLRTSDLLNVFVRTGVPVV